MNTGEAIVECCRVEGVRHIFGLIGSSHLEIVDSIARTNDIQFAGVRHGGTKMIKKASLKLSLLQKALSLAAMV